MKINVDGMDRTSVSKTIDLPRARIKTPFQILNHSEYRYLRKGGRILGKENVSQKMVEIVWDLKIELLNKMTRDPQTYQTEIRKIKEKVPSGTLSIIVPRIGWGKKKPRLKNIEEITKNVVLAQIESELGPVVGVPDLTPSFNNSWQKAMKHAFETAESYNLTPLAIVDLKLSANEVYQKIQWLTSEGFEAIGLQIRGNVLPWLEKAVATLLNRVDNVWVHAVDATKKIRYGGRVIPVSNPQILELRGIDTISSFKGYGSKRQEPASTPIFSTKRPNRKPPKQIARSMEFFENKALGFLPRPEQGCSCPLCRGHSIHDVLEFVSSSTYARSLVMIHDEFKLRNEEPAQRQAIRHESVEDYLKEKTLVSQHIKAVSEILSPFFSSLY